MVITTAEEGVQSRRTPWRHVTEWKYGKAIPVQVWTGSYGFRRLRPQELLDNQKMKVAKLSALCTGQLYPAVDNPGTHFR